MSFTQDWLPAGTAALLERKVRMARPTGMFVEVGAWEGRSTVAIANALAEHRTASDDMLCLVTIDPWDGRGSDESLAVAAERDILACWSENVDELTAGNVDPWVGTWRDWFAPLAGAAPCIMFLFIDGDHSEVEVADNLLAALPLMLPGGIIIGHDIDHPPVRAAVERVLGPEGDSWTQQEDCFVWVK